MLRCSRWTLHEHLLFQRRLCREGVAVMSEQNPRGKVLSALPLGFLLFIVQLLYRWNHHLLQQWQLALIVFD